jgi:hypothetical protein
MKSITVHAASYLNDSTTVEGTVIQITESLPIKHEEIIAAYKEDAAKIVEALQMTLPQGTLDRVTALLLSQRASSFVGPFNGGPLENIKVSMVV